MITRALFVGCLAASSPDSVDLLALQTLSVGTWIAPAWKTRGVRGKLAPLATVHDAADGRFVRIEGTDRAAFFVREFPAPVSAERGRLTISWRVPLAPAGADLRAARSDDSPLRIFVVFQTAGRFRATPRTIFYSSGAKEPATFSRPSERSTDLHVMRITESGNDSEWSRLTVQPAVDYAQVWGGTVPCIIAIGLMQDTDATRSHAVAELRHLFWRASDVTSH